MWAWKPKRLLGCKARFRAVYRCQHARSINLPRIVIRATGGRANLEASTTDISIRSENRLIVRTNRRLTSRIILMLVHFYKSLRVFFCREPISTYRFIEIYWSVPSAPSSLPNFYFITRLHARVGLLLKTRAHGKSKRNLVNRGERSVTEESINFHWASFRGSNPARLLFQLPEYAIFNRDAKRNTKLSWIKSARDNEDRVHASQYHHYIRNFIAASRCR